MAPVIGRAWIAYAPSDRVVGISKLARIVEACAKRLQIQEGLTAQLADTIEDALRPRGVGVVIKASHHCMTARGVHKPIRTLSPAAYSVAFVIIQNCASNSSA